LRKQLTSLDLSYNQIGDEGCSILGSSMGFERLRSLYIVQNELSIAGMLRITSSPTLWGLEEINLAQNYRDNVLALHSLPQDDVALLEESFASIASGGADLSRRFYENLFTFYPSVKPLFSKTNMQKQQRHLLSALMLVIENLRNPEAIEEQLLALGERHIGYGALPSHYYAVIETLLETLQEFFAERWSEKLHSTWENGLQAVANTLMRGHLRPKAYTTSSSPRSTSSPRPTASPQ
jgi:hemoglobin-like flavoprotein